MSTYALPSWLQFSAKLAIFAAAVALAVLHDLTPELAAVLSSALVALGLTNGASLVSQAASVGAALSPPPPPKVPPTGVVPVLALAVMSGVGLAACVHETDAQRADVRRVEDVLCAELKVRELIEDGGLAPPDAGKE